jgi:hypothetical protein
LNPGCKYKEMSDHVAARNIAARVAVNQPIVARFFSPKDGESYKLEKVGQVILKVALPKSITVYLVYSHTYVLKSHQRRNDDIFPASNFFCSIR